MTHLLNVEELVLFDENRRKILNNLSFNIKDGEVVGIIGANGSGKTTLMRCLYGALTHFNGRVEINGKNVKSLKPRQRALSIAAVTQETPADFQLSVRSVIATGRSPHQHWFTGSDPKGKHVIDKAIEQLQLNDFLERDINELSGGERKRVMICRALVQQPQLMILDEPCNHLDIEHQLNLMEILRELSVSSLVSLHDIPLAARYCDRLLILQAGKIVTQGKPIDILTPNIFKDVFGVHAETYNNPWNQWAFHVTSLPSLSKENVREKLNAQTSVKFSNPVSNPFAA